jgi:hypothetical protein
MTDDSKFPVKLCMTDVEAHELYQFLVDERPLSDRVTSPLSISLSTITKLHVALRDRSTRNKL